MDLVTDTEIDLRKPDVPEARAPRRGPERREAICEAVFELLGEVGYDRMSMDAVAARARASKATIYRGWPNKPDLVMDAFEHRYGGSSEPAGTRKLPRDPPPPPSLSWHVGDRGR